MEGGKVMPIRGGRAYRQSQHFKETIRERDGHTCQLCGKPGHEVDHIVPYAVSGETTPEGSRVLCVQCNRDTRRTRRDAALPVDEWYASIELELGVTVP